MPALMIAAPASGSGKTVVTLGLLRHLRDRGVAVASAKSGPDYIDPAFHAAASGRPCVNLDAWAMRPETLDALAARQSQLAILRPLLQLEHPDASYQIQAIGVYRAAGRIYAERGDLTQSTEQLEKALALSAQMLATEPANTETQSRAAWARFGLARTKLGAGAVDEAGALTRSGCDITDQLVAKDSTVVEWRLDLHTTCAELSARIALAHHDPGEAERQADDLLAAAQNELARSHSIDAQVARANALLMKGITLRAAGEAGASVAAFRQASAGWPAVPDRLQYLAQRAVIRKAVGDTAGAADLAHRLTALGFRDPLYLHDLESVG